MNGRYFGPPGEAVDGCGRCLATLRRGSGGPPFWRKATAAVVWLSICKDTTSETRLKAACNKLYY